MPSLAAAGALALALCANGGMANAQSLPSVSRPVVQALPPPESKQLSAALARLGRDPRDVDALIDAGTAALAMEDADAATGFFRRADQVSPSDPRVKAGLAAAAVRGGDPFTAIPLFDQAEKAGAQVSAIAADRGLAYDLVGDSAAAQRYYRLALARKADDAITRRLAVSQAIAGDRRGAEETLMPLLRKQDKSAWRTRTFVLAIAGEPEEAVEMANTLLPAALAENIAPYLRYMPRLTRAQQAAAANLGIFPRASEIGRDDPRVAQYAPASGASASVASLGEGLVPRGEPLGSGARPARARKEKPQKPAPAPRQAAASVVRTAPPEPQPAREVTSEAPERAVSAPATAAPELARARSGVARVVPTADPTDVASARPPLASPVPAPSPAPARELAPVRPEPAAAAVAAAPPSQAMPAPGFDLARLAQPASAPVPAPAPAPAPTSAPATSAVSPPAPDAAERPSLAEAFSDLGRPVASAAPILGAVDIRKITPAPPKPKPEKVAAKPAKPPPPSHPSRIWVQLGVGRNKPAMNFDWRRLARDVPDAFRGKKPSVSEMGQTNRLLAGPFPSEKAADEFLAQLRKAGIKGPYVWTSPAGQVVDALPAK